MTNRFILFRRNGANAFQLPLPESRATIGRGSECSICLPDPGRHLSRVHLELFDGPDGLLVVDRSANGTWLGGQRLPAGRARRWTSEASLQIPGWRAVLQTPRPHRGEDTSNCSYLPSGNATPVRPPTAFHGLLGSSAVMQALYADIRRIAPHPVPVLIRGETGTGKELVARALHTESSRSRAAFVAVNCGAIHQGTAASTLFGHRRGAFTGATTDQRGAIRDADGGTLFLDELGELPPQTQAALLRTLEAREVVPLGTTRPVSVDFRLLAATHCDLERMVADGLFRADLLFRLNVASLHIPPLRDRPGDIEELVRHFVGTLAVGPPTPLDAATVAALRRYPWPGNVRELRNASLRAVLHAEGGPILPGHLQLPTAPWEEPTDTLDGRTAAIGIPGSGGLRAAATVREHERRRLVRALADHGGNRKAAAAALGIARSTLYERLRRLGIA